MIPGLLASPTPEPNPCYSGNDATSVGATIGSVMGVLASAFVMNIAYAGIKYCYQAWMARREEARQDLEEASYELLQDDMDSAFNNVEETDLSLVAEAIEERQRLINAGN